MSPGRLKAYAATISALVMAGMGAHDRLERRAARAERDGNAINIGARGMQADAETRIRAESKRRRALARARRAAMVRECAACWSEFPARCRTWVQPCLREDREGCDDKCRPSKNACERAQADARDLNHGRDEAWTNSAYERLGRHCPERLNP